MAEIPQTAEQPATQDSGDKPQLKLVVRNTFLDVVDPQPTPGTLKHSKSDSDISSLSGSKPESESKSGTGTPTNSARANQAATVLPSNGSKGKWGQVVYAIVCRFLGIFMENMCQITGLKAAGDYFGLIKSCEGPKPNISFWIFEPLEPCIYGF